MDNPDRWRFFSLSLKYLKEMFVSFDLILLLVLFPLNRYQKKKK